MKKNFKAWLAGALCLTAGVAAAQTWPTLSSDGNESWYHIQFNNGGYFITDNGVGSLVKTVNAATTDANLWKVVGSDYNNVQFVSKAGTYMNYNGSRVEGASSADSKGFKIVSATNGSDGLEVVYNGATDKYTSLNMFGGAAAGREIGLWTPGDGGNILDFILEGTYEGPVVLPEYSYTGSETYVPDNHITLWYKAPGTIATFVQRWVHGGMSIGNGQFGGTVLGGIHSEELSYNEKTLWTGTANDNGSYGCYQNFGTLYINTLDGDPLESGASDYWRNLDLATGIANVHFQDKNGVNYDREFLASYPDGVIAARLAADKAGALNLHFGITPGMKRGLKPTYTADGTATFAGKFETVAYNSHLRVIPVGENAKMTADDKGITVTDADEVILILAGGTDFDAYADSFTTGVSAETLASDIEARAKKGADKGWASIKADHIADHQALMGRVDLKFENTKNDMPTNELIAKYQGWKNSSKNKPYVLALEQLYFAYGRYLEIGSSRGVDLPSNLQGIWSGYDIYKPYGGQIAPWNADIHANINVQMNYWPAEPTNLSETHLPFLNYIINMAAKPQWQKYAKDSGQTKGWTCYTENNIFGGVGSFMHNYTIANAWYATHLWQHYQYTLDKEFLKKAMPAMWSCCEFWLERLKKAKDGTYECPNEYSPEHGPSEDATAHSQQLVAELFANTLEAAKILGSEAGISDSDLAKLQDRYDNLDKGLAIETYDGEWGSTVNGVKSGTPIMREWKYSTYKAGANGHRHNSHMMCLYPYSQVRPGTEEFDAVVNSLKLRGDGATGWSMGWKINLWARALDGKHARTILSNALAPAAQDMASQGGAGVYNNLYDSHSPFQIDGNFGACAGIAEMLMQSHDGTVNLLPALPPYWAGGSISGLKAIGDFTVDVTWTNKALASATIVSNQGTDLTVRHTPGLLNVRFTVDGKAVEPKLLLNNTEAIIECEPGTKVEMTYDAEYTNPNGESSIEEVGAGLGETVAVRCIDRTVQVSGAPVSRVSVYDMTGRVLAETAKSSVKVAATGVVLVKVTTQAGKVSSHKVTVR